MDTILASLTTSISEFKSNPSAALKKAGKKPFAVLTNNKPSFYVMTPELYESITELLLESAGNSSYQETTQSIR